MSNQTKKKSLLFGYRLAVGILLGLAGILAAVVGLLGIFGMIELEFYLSVALLVVAAGAVGLCVWFFELAAKLGRRSGKIRENRVFHAVNYALLFLIILACVLPFINVVAKGFSTFGRTVSLLPVGFTFYNFKYVFTQWPYFRAFLVSVGVTVGGTALSVSIMFAAAYALSKEYMVFRKGIMIFFIIIMLFSGGIVPNFFVMKTLGLLNTPFALIFPSVVQVYNLILLKNFLEGVPREIEESAHIDGANHFHVMVQILFPIALPSVASVSLFTAVSYWNNYFAALVYLPSGDTFWPLAMYILNYINSVPDVLGDQVLYNQKTYIEMAMIIVSILPILAIYPFVTKFFVKGVTVGSVKG